MAAFLRCIGLQIWRLVLLPGALPAIMAGLRLGLCRAIAGMVVVEFLLVAVGIGDLLMRYRADFESGRVFAVILLVLAEAVTAVALITCVEIAVAGRTTGEEIPMIEVVGCSKTYPGPDGQPAVPALDRIGPGRFRTTRSFLFSVPQRLRQNHPARRFLAPVHWFPGL